MSENRDGIDRLRGAIDEVARELETRRPPVRSPVPRWVLAAAAAVIAVTAWSIWFRPSAPPEVEILVLKIRGRPVQARMVDGEAPSTIIVVPQNGITRTPTPVAVITGGAP